MSTVFLGGFRCVDPARLRADCLDLDLPVSPWEGRANLYTCPAGRTPGRGAVLMRKADLDALPVTSDHALRFLDNATDLSLPAMTIYNSTCVVPGFAGEKEQVYLVRFADRRLKLAHGPGVNRAFNVVKDPGASPDYEPGTTPGGSTPYTWQEVVTALWTAAGVSGSSTLPFTPHGTPHQLTFFGGSAYDALNDVLDRLAVALDFNPITGAFTLVRIGSQPSDETQALAKLAGHELKWDGRPRAAAVDAPATVRVLMRIAPRPTDGTSQFRAVDLSSGITGGAGTVILHDDLVVSGNPNGSELAIITARATERRDDWVRKFTYRDRGILKTFRDLASEVFTVIGGTATAATIEDRGEGLRTELVSGPDGALERLRYSLTEPDTEVEPTEPQCSAEGVAWVLAKEVYQYTGTDGSIPAKWLGLVIKNGTFLCGCLGEQGDSATRRFLDQATTGGDTAGTTDYQTGDTWVRGKLDPGTGIYKAIGNFTGCCGSCFRVDIEIDTTKPTLPGMVIGSATVTGTFCKVDASGSFTLYVGCGSRTHGYVKLMAYSSAVCNWPPDADDVFCDSTFELWAKCLPCDIPLVDCAVCAGGKAPLVWELTKGSDKFFPVSSGSCAWSESCGGATITVACDKITAVVEGATYEKPITGVLVCFGSHTLDFVSGPGGSPASITIKSVDCKPEGGECPLPNKVSSSGGVPCSACGGSPSSTLVNQDMTDTTFGPCTIAYSLGGGGTNPTCECGGVFGGGSCTGFSVVVIYLGGKKFMVLKYSNAAALCSGAGQFVAYEGPETQIVENTVDFPDVLFQANWNVTNPLCEESPSSGVLTFTNM